jgi:hypothetical protein
MKSIKKNKKKIVHKQELAAKERTGPQVDALPGHTQACSVLRQPPPPSCALLSQREIFTLHLRAADELHDYGAWRSLAHDERPREGKPTLAPFPHFLKVNFILFSIISNLI